MDARFRRYDFWNGISGDGRKTNQVIPLVVVDTMLAGKNEPEGEEDTVEQTLEGIN